MKIVFLDSATIGSASLEPIRTLGDLTTYGTSTEEQARARIVDAEILIVNKIKVTSSLMDAAPKLRLICETATGTNNIDINAACERNIQVRNVTGYSTDSVVQLTFAQILSLTSQTERFDRYVKDGSYSRSNLFTEVSSPYMEIAGKTIGIIGMGTIGQKVAALARAFSMKVIYYSTSGTSHCTLYPSVSLDCLLSQSDIITIHAPLNDRTVNLIGLDELKKMKRTAYVINMARGGIINEDDLSFAISNEIISGAAIDVFSDEPIFRSSPFLNTTHPERLLLTPHVAWASQEAIERLVKATAENIRNFIITVR